MTKPFTLIEAAGQLGMSERWLRAWLADNPVDAKGVPFYIPMGRRKEFEPSDIERIRTRIRELEQCRLNYTVAVPSGITAEQLARMAVGKGSVVRPTPKTKSAPRARLPRSSADTGKVIDLAPARS
ncbi:hypothetical protein [Bradyrhizobium sp. 930_D9_N1_4]|uniref:hypothetical protein n=1 Tax=Bradyrhizobium sp. 930_D9_N1_4 TaxID=3240374 RepID=UPI003F8B5EBA